MLKPVITFFFAFITYQSLGQIHRTGLVFDDTKYKKLSKLSPALRFSDAASNRTYYSLKKYCPTPGDQGEMGACVGWTTGYAALTISYAVKYNIQSVSEINKIAKSPLFVYNQIKPNYCDKGLCQCGTDAAEALEFVERNGICDFKDFNPNSCDINPSSDVFKKAKNCLIENSTKLFDVNDSYETIINAVVNSLNANKPVVTGFQFLESFQKVKKDGYWNPSTNEIPNGGHAVCVIGYDNNSKRFELINSWGTDWGNGGFFTVSYQTFARLFKRGFQFTLKDKDEEMLLLTGKFQFKKFSSYNENTHKYEFMEVSANYKNGYYTITNGNVKLDDFYRIVASGCQKNSYVYIFSLKPNKTFEIIFPLKYSEGNETINDLPFIPNDNVTIEIPVDDTKGLSTDIKGEDVLCILYSNQKILDIEKKIETINAQNGELMSRLQNSFGSILIPTNNIYYDNNTMSFISKTKVGTGNIVPIILKVNVSN